MKLLPLELDGAYQIELSPIGDERGSFARLFCQETFSQIRPDLEFVQINLSENARKGTIRGMHYQLPPSAEAKLVGCVAGAALDVMVDVRKGSPTFLQHFAVELNPRNHRLVFIPEGFAHGFQTLADDTRMIYCHTAFYDPQSEAAIHYADPAVDITWPLEDVTVSAKDQARAFLTSEFKGVVVQ